MPTFAALWDYSVPNQFQKSIFFGYRQTNNVRQVVIYLYINTREHNINLNLNESSTHKK